MLTDYHVHLRPDDEDTPPARYFTAANAERYRAAAEERGIRELGVSEHIHRFIQSLEIWEHPWWRHWARDDVDAYCAFVREETDLRLGIEADYVTGREDRIARFLEAREWDYVIGSVHFVRDAAVDLEGPDWEHVWGRGESADKVWQRYFETLAEAARSGLYDVMAHPDLVKVWGSARPLPERRPAPLLQPAVEAMLDAGVAMEVSTAGLRKPVASCTRPRRCSRWRWTPASRSRSPPTRTSRARSATATRRPSRGCATRASPRSASSRPRAPDGATRLMLRTGLGIDTHAFAPGRPLILGGVEVPSEQGLQGWSDADVLTHAIMDALLGAAGLGDIGQHFPDTDAAGRAPIRLRSCATSWPTCGAAAARSPTSTPRSCSSGPSSRRTATPCGSGSRTPSASRPAP